ncbi:agmatinase [Oharaeibacter diazotrophicus]|uniref:Guanidinopropionase n=1 Tax=Oharaeibacter diazotrophicus TaxID=1920512 RepID=A0A4R6RKL2_9HYPH|nr:agmatinase [Oharaeibacter diazotrophicus]TDP87201.1 guanidinopropionase [Oharaeibacter diazotrophicus]BBE70856.1 guanidinobutyrase [Pleomorphomonas sp. SM30]GLS77605.1 guanidinopropionase [Oharaeibacter diazotrophicus]
MDAFDPAFLPVSGFDLPRYAGIPTFMRLPHAGPADGVEVGLVGVPWDGGTTNRPGARHGPRALRDASTMVRMVNQATAAAPFHTVRCADLGDVPPNPASLDDSLERIRRFYADLVARGVTPLTAGGDHLTSLPVLRAVAAGGAVGMIHFDSHTDLYDDYFGGYKLTHGTPFRRAIEEGLLDPKRIVQIGIRGSTYDGEDREYAAEVGVRIVGIEELMDRGPEAVMAEARAIVGTGPVYVSFDIDGVDPAQAPGTGTPEIGGFSTHVAQRMVRALDGLDIVGADLVEVSPPFDVGGITAYAGASLMFELLCVVANAVARRKGRAAVVNERLARVLGGPA